MHTPTRNTDPATASDIIADMLQRIAPLLGVPPANPAQALATIEKDLRNLWGGDRVYIPHRRGGESGQLHSERNSRIERAYKSGRHIAWLAKTEGLSERRVHQIIGTLRAGRKPAGQG